MGVHDRVHLRPVPVDPEVEAVRRVHHAVALQHVEVVVEQHDVARLCLVEAEAEAEHQ